MRLPKILVLLITGLFVQACYICLNPTNGIFNVRARAAYSCTKESASRRQASTLILLVISPHVSRRALCTWQDHY